MAQQNEDFELFREEGKTGYAKRLNWLFKQESKNLEEVDVKEEKS